MWPRRGVAEDAYCPRLFYYMTVESNFAPSDDTEQGKGTHRRVDRPSAGSPKPRAKENGDRRLRHTHKLMKAHGEAWRFFIFHCTLKAIDRVRRENALRDVVVV